MQPLRYLESQLSGLANPDHYLFTPDDLRALVPRMTAVAFRALIHRAEKRGLLQRVCRGLYLYPGTDFDRGLLLFHAAARLRARYFNYLSLETVLSDAGVISQMPLQWITLMSSGRSNRISCGQWGNIEFVHTSRSPDEVADQLVYDRRCHLWRASVSLALRDMKATRRSLELVDWSSIDEPV